MYCLSEIAKEIEAALHAAHCYVFDDKDWNIDDYIELYGPLVVFIIYEVLILLIAGIVH